ncbi:MAG: Alpha-ketoglutarate-dependent taurine dioxygenase [Alphaproteobacteria bacterium MarineAlpha10_Bin3]|jgi:alpha-ketoglutarate-dependent taurine dioxygenase|nr:MAG: Alpha-ketoglutarate-dependent taurine dioxygenase [Alphaproteobacteria bacterium MarineAlpha10_Bin3]PPR74533.1 MAG: Alpha-ketoglutarate-dependent taurine dioxygenase [Alphaproteobacteria bacterium MarineAlpha4_Bin1]
MPATQTTLRIDKIKDHIGAEANGIDLRQPLDAATFRRLHDALIDNVALVIRDQKFTAAQFQDAAALFGELMEDQNRLYLAPGVPMVSTLSNRHKDSTGAIAKVGKNGSWHTDHTNQECPPKYTMLYAVELPDRGGGTAVCNMRDAYAALPGVLRRRIAGMETANTLISSTRFGTGNPDIVREQRQSANPPMIHPLVRTHPDNGTKAIWFHKNKVENILGIEPHETQDFLAGLLERAMRPEFVYLHESKLGDMLIVDNRSAMHKAGFDFDHCQHRLLYRALVRGGRPV